MLNGITGIHHWSTLTTLQNLQHMTHYKRYTSPGIDIHVYSLIDYCMLHCRYPIRKPRVECWGDGSPGVISYGEKEPDETFDVYCLADKMSGKPIFW